MDRYFNINGVCDPAKHYMVNLDSRLQYMRRLVDRGEYFVINRARQYGKTTTIRALGQFLKRKRQIPRLLLKLLLVYT